MVYLDPALAVACPTCDSAPHSPCTIAGKELSGVHATRTAALEARNAQTGTIR